MNDKRPSIVKIIWVNYWAFLSAIFAIVGPSIYIYDRFFAPKPTENFFWIAIGIFFSALLGLLTRIVSILSICNNGQNVKATIFEIGFFRDRGHIKFLYTFQGQKYIVRQRVMKNKITLQFQHGQEVDILINSENPKKAVIKDLFM